MWDVGVNKPPAPRTGEGTLAWWLSREHSHGKGFHIPLAGKPHSEGHSAQHYHTQTSQARR